MSLGLKLTRQKDESVFIENRETGDVIKVKILDIDRGQIKIGLDAPPEYSILRGELPKYEEPEEYNGN